MKTGNILLISILFTVLVVMVYMGYKKGQPKPFTGPVIPDDVNWDNQNTYAY